jgi:hypothetical protein
LPNGITKLSGVYQIRFTDEEAAELLKGIAITPYQWKQTQNGGGST